MKNKLSDLTTRLPRAIEQNESEELLNRKTSIPSCHYSRNGLQPQNGLRQCDPRSEPPHSGAHATLPTTRPVRRPRGGGRHLFAAQQAPAPGKESGASVESRRRDRLAVWSVEAPT